MEARRKASQLFSRLTSALASSSEQRATSVSAQKTLFLHVGTHKTGTSALQDFLSVNRRALQDAGVVYPLAACNPAGAHHFLANALKGPPFPVLKPEKSFEDYLNDLHGELQGYRTAVISSEIFMRFLPSFEPDSGPKLSNLKRLLPLADRVRPVVYFRRQQDYLESFYRQTILDQHNYTPAEFLENRYLDYLAVCHDLESIFGPRSVIVREYDKTRFVGGGLFSDFLSVLGVELDDSFNVTDQKLNSSFVPDAVEFRRLISCLGATLEQARSFNGTLMRYSGARQAEQGATVWRELFLDEETRADIGARSAPVNRQVELEYCASSTGEPFLVVEPPVGKIPCMYAGLDQATVSDIVAYMRQDSPQQVELLAAIACHGDISLPGSEEFLNMLLNSL